MANNNGTYCVTITGATGCTSSSCVVVALAILSNTPELEIVPLSYCPGQTIQLKTEILFRTKRQISMDGRLHTRFAGRAYFVGHHPHPFA